MSGLRADATGSGSHAAPSAGPAAPAAPQPAEAGALGGAASGAVGGVGAEGASGAVGAEGASGAVGAVGAGEAVGAPGAADALGAVNAEPAHRSANGRADSVRVGLVWAEAAGGVIGRAGGMPWHVPEDLAHFKAVTLGGPVIMGRKTWESLNPRYRPLPGRRNIVVTRQADWSAEGAERAGSLDEALALAAVGVDDERGGPEQLWVIGGGELFAEAIGRADRLEVTELVHPGGFEPEPGDVHAPPVPSGFTLVSVDPPAGEHTSRTGIHYRFLSYRR